MSSVEVTEPLLHYAFNIFDMDCDGFISKYDLQAHRIVAYLRALLRRSAAVLE